MSEQTLYEILEVNEKATPDKIRAAWTRLSVKWDPLRPHNYDHEARTRYEQIKDAYVTLGSPHKRAAYDRRLQLRRRQQSSQEQQSRAGVQPKLAVAALVAAIVLVGGSYFMTRDQGPMVTARAKSPADYLPKDALEAASNEDDSRQQETIVAVSLREPAPARVSVPRQEARVALSSVVKPREEPLEQRSEPVALKLDKDLTLGKRGSTALSQL